VIYNGGKTLSIEKQKKELLNNLRKWLEENNLSVGDKKTINDLTFKVKEIDNDNKGIQCLPENKIDIRPLSLRKTVKEKIENYEEIISSSMILI